MSGGCDSLEEILSPEICLPNVSGPLPFQDIASAAVLAEGHASQHWNPSLPVTISARFTVW